MPAPIWNNKQTCTIRIPEVFKSDILNYAKELDEGNLESGVIKVTKTELEKIEYFVLGEKYNQTPRVIPLIKEALERFIELVKQVHQGELTLATKAEKVMEPEKSLKKLSPDFLKSVAPHLPQLLAQKPSIKSTMSNLSISDLQVEVITLLLKASSLIQSASTTLFSDKSGTKYAQFYREINEETQKVEKLELPMAVVAPMKAGKSTIINAIVGRDLLPSRNAAMTTLPTEIFLTNDRTCPKLLLSEQLVDEFRKAIGALQSKADQIGMSRAKEQLNEHPYLIELLQSIQTGAWNFSVETVGDEEINKTLTGLNDIIRLCSILRLNVNPLKAIASVPRIETPFCRIQGDKQSERQGNLIIVDTPGPNEAGKNLELYQVVKDQLQKSSIVVIVLNFTTLNTDADEKVKQEVERIIKLRGDDNLYVLINKVDQRIDTDEGTTPEKVHKFVAAKFGINSRIFEVSARWAFFATNFLSEVQENPKKNILELKTVRPLAQQVLGGSRWEYKLKDINTTIENLQKEAQYLWDDSGFPKFLEEAINALMRKIAPVSMKSALSLTRSYLTQLCEDMQLRKKAIAADADVLRQQITALEKDLQDLELSRLRLQQVRVIQNNLEQQIDTLLSQFDDYKLPSELIKLFGTQGEVQFISLSLAEDFQDKVYQSIRQELDKSLDKTREEITRLTEKARHALIEFLQRETKPIIQRAQQRLNEAFDLELYFMSPRVFSDDIKIVSPRRTNIKSKSESWIAWETRHERRWYTLWLWEHEIQVPVKQWSQYYVITRQEITDLFKESIKQNVLQIQRKTNQYLDEDFQEKIAAFFESLDLYLSNYRDNLRQAQEDKELSDEQQNKLLETLDLLVFQVNEQIEQAGSYLSEIKQQFMLDN
ncbi:dynamin family protein [Nostoc sp. LPT]|uniref:dynamin family protein n=1 Tax=Nostoc sp. LPT TaxID=2815387 RepID=UPI001D931EEB|nr:dynamin family protein [Nostoc sp. LPT]MBN4003295.1 dynamin family protein [Nostoc sp. LPT]